MKINNLVEKIFSTAVALDQSGGLKNTIYAIEDSIFILNYDHTVLLRFKLRSSETSFSEAISFKANDYDSEVFEQKGNSIIFHSDNGKYTRKKTCGTTDLTPKEVRKLFKEYYSAQKGQGCILTRDVLELLDDSLSHVEFSGDGEGLKIVQRNIYSGGVIEVREKSGGMLGSSITSQFEPIAIKTDDLRALFSFEDSLTFYFPNQDSGDNFICVQSLDKHKRDFTAFIACCMYDEIIELRKSKN